ncbi:hypothetical protein [Orenia marismortui]|uniref:hypothetical protein n=1 Tax=Orenia marismortui TaxID=46469 RepID=UPI000369A86E|nr:hypothetical protein [Orenia marismortui]
MSDDISKEKLEWMEEVGMKRFDEPMEYHLFGHIFSEGYLKRTPLEVLKERHGDKDC